jgi:hypothetical protein
MRRSRTGSCRCPHRSRPLPLESGVLPRCLTTSRRWRTGATCGGSCILCPGFCCWWSVAPSPIATATRTLPPGARRISTSCAGTAPLHLVSAFATTARRVLAQEAVPDKANELAAIPPLPGRTAPARRRLPDPGRDPRRDQRCGPYQDPLLPLVPSPHRNRRRSRGARALGHRKPTALGARRHLRRRPIPPAKRPRRPHHGHHPPPRPQPRPNRRRQTLHQIPTKTRRMEPKLPQRHPLLTTRIPWIRNPGGSMPETTALTRSVDRPRSPPPPAHRKRHGAPLTPAESRPDAFCHWAGVRNGRSRRRSAGALPLIQVGRRLLRTKAKALPVRRQRPQRRDQQGR